MAKAAEFLLKQAPAKKLKRVVVTGGRGQLGQALDSLRTHAQELEIELLITNKSTLDICSMENINQFLNTYPVDGLINAAAYTQVDMAETHTDLAWSINVTGPSYLADACKERDIALLHLSSDYVFDGCKTSPYLENDTALPLSTYGRSKLAGEQAITNTMPQALVLRTSWLFSQYGHNFYKTILRSAKNKVDLRVVADQYGGPTYAPSVATVLLKIMAQQLNHKKIPGGVYHFSGQPCVSWYGFAQEILTQAHKHGLLPKPPNLTPITSDEFPQAATRPRSSCLSLAKLSGIITLPDHDWRKGLALSLSADD